MEEEADTVDGGKEVIQALTATMLELEGIGAEEVPGGTAASGGDT